MEAREILRHVNSFNAVRVMQLLHLPPAGERNDSGPYGRVEVKTLARFEKHFAKAEDLYTICKFHYPFELIVISFVKRIELNNFLV